MDLSNLKPAAGAVKAGKRIGRGQGSGRGGTSTRGHKGDRARSGSKEKRHFEGGQTPMQRRLPKRGFKNVNRLEYTALNIGALEAIVQKLGMSVFEPATFVGIGIARASDKIKVLGKGILTSKVNIKVHAISASAKAAIEAAGGSVELV